MATLDEKNTLSPHAKLTKSSQPLSPKNPNKLVSLVKENLIKLKEWSLRTVFNILQ